MLLAIGGAGNWLGSLPGHHSSCKWLSRWFWVLWVRTKPKVQTVPRLHGTVEMPWAWLAWETEDLWCSFIKGRMLSLTRGQGSWHPSVALSLVFPIPGEFRWLSPSGDLQFKCSLFLLTRGIQVASYSHEVVDTEHQALALILLLPRAGPLSKSLIKSLKSCPSQFHCQSFCLLVPWWSHQSPNLDFPWAAQPMESCPASLAWYWNPNYPSRFIFFCICSLCSGQTWPLTLSWGLCVSNPHGFAGPFTWDAFSLPLEVPPSI